MRTTLILARLDSALHVDEVEAAGTCFTSLESSTQNVYVFPAPHPARGEQ
jgi:hypothetical protein